MTVIAPESPSTVAVLATQEIRRFSRSPLFVIGSVVAVVGVLASVLADTDDFDALTVSIVPAASLGLLGMVTMFGLARHSDRAAAAAGSVPVPERQRTLALAAATIVPGSLALVLWVIAMVGFGLRTRPDWLLPPGVPAAFVMAQSFGTGVLAAVGGPIFGLVLARYVPRRGASALAAVVIVVITILLQGNFEGGQPYRVVWVWTYFVGQLSQGWPSDGSEVWHMSTAPGNPFLWIVYLLSLCCLGVVVAVLHDRETDRGTARVVAGALVAVAVVAAAVTMTVGYTDVRVNPSPCARC